MKLRVLLVATMIMLLSGCASIFSSYPSQAEGWIRSYQNGQTEKLISTLTPKLEDNDGLLYGLELGRLAQLGGQTEASKQGFEVAFQAFETIDERAKLRASAAAGGVGAMLTNDNALAYKGQDYERIFAHSYQALNYLKLGNAEGAAVELRRANLEQTVAAEKRDKEIAKAEAKAAEEDIDLKQHEGSFAGLNQAAGRVKSSFQNAYTFYLSAVFWEAAGDYNSALVDLKRAYEINPDALFIEEDIRRVQRRMGDRVQAPLPGKDEGSLVILFEQGQVQPKRELSLPIPTIHGAFAVSFPTYDPADIIPAVPLTAADSEGNGVLRTQVIAEVGAMAAYSLKEEIPAMLVRQTLRAATKYALQKQANDASPFAGLATNLYNLVSEQADLRSWLTLPLYVQAARTIVPAGEKQIMLSGAGVNQTVNVSVSPGGTTIVRVITTGGVPVVETYRL